MDAVLDYLDQASLLGRRALGRGPVGQLVWIYDRPVDVAALEAFNQRLAGGLLGRLVERSPLPFGRHRWVRADAPPLKVAGEAIARDRVLPWADSLVWMPIDPEAGPGYRLIVQPIDEGGGTAVSLVVSHTIADGLAVLRSVAAAASGQAGTIRYPEPRSRRWRDAVAEDARVTVRSLGDVRDAVSAAVRLARRNRRPAVPAFDRGRDRMGPGSPTALPSVWVRVESGEWARRAEQLGGSGPALAAALAARIGWRAGRSGEGGTVSVSVPVSIRRRSDTRGNALTGVMLEVEAARVPDGVGEVGAQMGARLRALVSEGDPLLAPAPLTPFVPKALARRLEALAAGDDGTVGCSHLGSVDPAVNRPDGTDADALWGRLIEPVEVGASRAGPLMVVLVETHGWVALSVWGWQPGMVETRAALAGHVRGALDDLALPFELLPFSD